MVNVSYVRIRSVRWSTKLAFVDVAVCNVLQTGVIDDSASRTLRMDETATGNRAFHLQKRRAIRRFISQSSNSARKQIGLETQFEQRNTAPLHADLASACARFVTIKSNPILLAAARDSRFSSSDCFYGGADLERLSRCPVLRRLGSPLFQNRPLLVGGGSASV